MSDLPAYHTNPLLIKNIPEKFENNSILPIIPKIEMQSWNKEQTKWRNENFPNDNPKWRNELTKVKYVHSLELYYNAVITQEPSKVGT